jgi:hypothetical protein
LVIKANKKGRYIEMDSKALKASWIIISVVICVGIIIGLLFIFMPAFFIIGEFGGFTGQQWTDFTVSNSKASSFFLLEKSQMGFYIVMLGITELIVILLAYRKREKWAWYLLLIIETLGWGGTIGYDIPTGDMEPVMTS